MYHSICALRESSKVESKRVAKTKPEVVLSVTGASGAGMLSRFIVPTGAGLIAKVFLCCSPVKVVGLPAFLSLLRGDERGDRGLLTGTSGLSLGATLTSSVESYFCVSPVRCGRFGTDESSVDEPFMWGKLPLSTFYSPRTVRWTLGASDIMFTTPFVPPLLSRQRG